MIDLRRYYRLDPKGACSIEKCDSGFVVLFKRFDNETGEALTEEPQYITIDELKKVHQDLSIQINAIESIIEKINGLLG
jgi:hypothetical protein